LSVLLRIISVVYTVNGTHWMTLYVPKCR